MISKYQEQNEEWKYLKYPKVTACQCGYCIVPFSPWLCYLYVEYNKLIALIYIILMVYTEYGIYNSDWPTVIYNQLCTENMVHWWIDFSCPLYDIKHTNDWKICIFLKQNWKWGMQIFSTTSKMILIHNQCYYCFTLTFAFLWKNVLNNI